MNKEYATAKEISGSPTDNIGCWPSTERGVRKKASILGIPKRKRTGTKAWEYLISALPIATQFALGAIKSNAILAQSPAPLESAQNKITDIESRALNDAKAAQLEGAARARMDARHEIVRLFARYAKETRLPGIKKVGGELHKESFIAAWNQGQLHSTAQALYPRLSTGQLERWQKQLTRQGLARLAGNYGNRKDCGLIDSQPQLAAALQALLYEYPHVGPRAAYRWLCDRYDALPAEIAGDGPIQLPSIRTVARWLEAWKRNQAEIYTLIKNPDEWKNKYMVGWGDAAAGVMRLNQIWEFDSTPADVMLKDGRHSILGVIDVYSRRVRLHVSKTSRATAVAHLLRGALIDWGVPEMAKTDNGQEYVSHHLTRIFQALDIEHHTSQPFSPWQKPFIERFFRTFSHDLLEYLPGYIGHNVAEREALRARQQFSDRLFVKNRAVELGLTAGQLQEFCDQWAQRYHHSPHTGLGGQRPLERVLTWQEPVRYIPNPRILDLLLSEAPGDGWRTVTKSYGLQIDSYQYQAVELALCVGDRVKVLYDPEGDLGKVYVFDGRGDFVCIAECPEVTGVDRRQLATQAKAIQWANAKRLRHEGKASAKKLNVRATFDQVLMRRDELLALPAPGETASEAYDTASIRGALDALANRTALNGSEGFTPQKAREMGYLEDLKAEKPEKPAKSLPAPNVVHVNNDFDDIRETFMRTHDGHFAPGDASAVARFYAAYPKPRHFEKQMADLVGESAFYVWKSAALAEAKREQEESGLASGTRQAG